VLTIILSGFVIRNAFHITHSHLIRCRNIKVLIGGAIITRCVGAEEVTSIGTLRYKLTFNWRQEYDIPLGYLGPLSNEPSRGGVCSMG